MSDYVISPVIDALSLATIRLYVSDTDQPNQVWTDTEINIAWNAQRQSNDLAAAVLMEVAAGNAAKLAIIQENDKSKTDLTKIASNLLSVAKRFRDSAVIAPTSFSARNPDLGLTAYPPCDQWGWNG